jgi:hypothetical protein
MQPPKPNLVQIALTIQHQSEELDNLKNQIMAAKFI